MFLMSSINKPNEQLLFPQSYDGVFINFCGRSVLNGEYRQALFYYFFMSRLALNLS